MMLLAQNDPSFPPGIAFVILLGFLVLVVLAAIYGTTAAKRRDDQLQAVARKLGGRLQTGGVFSMPELRFSHGNQTFLLSYTGGGENEVTKTNLAAPWPNHSLRCEIFPEGPVTILRKLLGMQDIEIGSPRFDNQFIITGNDEAAIKALLTRETQEAIFALCGLTAVPDIYVQIASGRLTVKKACYLTDAPSVERFIRLFRELYDAATTPSFGGIEFLDQPHSVDEIATRCVVCGESLAGDLVSCQSCKTPHHHDCWQYFGGCATYACGGKQFVQRKGHA